MLSERERFQNPEDIEPEKENPLDLNNEEVVDKILVEGTPEQIEKLRAHYNLSPEQIDSWVYYGKLRDKVLRERRENFKQRIQTNPEPTEEEWQMGAYKEEIEPQVSGAVMSLRKKGYDTYESGFYGPEMQRIGFYGEPLQNFQLSRETQDLIKAKGFEVKILPDGIELYYGRKLELDELQEVWDQIAQDLPDLGHPAKFPARRLEAFQGRVANIKKDPTPFLED